MFAVKYVTCLKIIKSILSKNVYNGDDHKARVFMSQCHIRRNQYDFSAKLFFIRKVKVKLISDILIIRVWKQSTTNLLCDN